MPAGALEHVIQLLGRGGAVRRVQGVEGFHDRAQVVSALLAERFFPERQGTFRDSLKGQLAEFCDRGVSDLEINESVVDLGLDSGFPLDVPEKACCDGQKDGERGD